MGARVAFLDPKGERGPSSATGTTLVPADAVRTEGNDGIVFVYANDRVERRSVTLGRQVGASREILKGIRDGERVVLSPPASLKDGDAVKLADKG
jgi:hypothetical protein